MSVEENTPIDELMAQYESEGCNFSDQGYVKRSAERLVKTMPDSFVRCLVYALSKQIAGESFANGYKKALEDMKKALEKLQDKKQ